MKKIICILLVFAGIFLHLYQKQKILILAYEINGKKMDVERLTEHKSNIVCSFLRETNLAAINQRFMDDGLHFQYPRAYVRLAPERLPAGVREPRSTVFARMLGLATRAEARQVEAKE